RRSYRAAEDARHRRRRVREAHNDERPSRGVPFVAPMPKSPDVFLSHNSKDKPAVRELAAALRARGIEVWLDADDLLPGQRWQEELEKVIKTAASGAVLVGGDGFG